MTSPNKSDACQYLSEKGREACPEGMHNILDLILNSGETSRGFSQTNADSIFKNYPRWFA
jgi:hypothetical protein